MFHSKSVLYGAFVWARRALNRPFRRFPARADNKSTEETTWDAPEDGVSGYGGFSSSSDDSDGSSSDDELSSIDAEIAEHLGA